MRSPVPLWFIYVLCGLVLALLVCLFLVPAVAQPGDGGVVQQVRFVFPRL